MTSIGCFKWLLPAVAALAALPAAAKELQYSSHLPPVVLVNKAGVIPVFDAVTKATGGEITVKYFWAGQLYNAAGNFDAVSEGVIDAAFTQPADNQAEMPVNLLFADLYHFGGNPYATAAAVNETILLGCPACVAEYAASNAVFLGTHATTPTVMVCNAEIGSMEDLKGKRVIGQPTIAPFVQTFGATQLDVPPPARMEAMQRQQAECTLISPDWMKAFSLSEVAKTVIDVPTGSQFAISMMTMNKDSWDGFSPEVRKAFLTAMPQALQAVIAGYEVEDKLAVEEAKAKGAVFTDLGGAYKAALDAYMAGYEAQVIASAKARGVENPEQIVAAFKASKARWEKLLTEKGVDRFGDLLWEEIYSKIDM